MRLSFFPSLQPHDRIQRTASIHRSSTGKTLLLLRPSASSSVTDPVPSSPSHPSIAPNSDETLAPLSLEEGEHEAAKDKKRRAN